MKTRKEADQFANGAKIADKLANNEREKSKEKTKQHADKDHRKKYKRRVTEEEPYRHSRSNPRNAGYSTSSINYTYSVNANFVTST